MPCENARSLVASYLDGELSEGQAAPLRGHLLACRDCRELAKREKSLKNWFVDEEIVIPAGFAGEVAQLAFADVHRSESAPFDETQMADETETNRFGTSDNGRRSAGTLLPFVLKISTLAAGLLFILAIAIQRESLPAGDGLDARTPPWEKEAPVKEWNPSRGIDNSTRGTRLLPATTPDLEADGETSPEARDEARDESR